MTHVETESRSVPLQDANLPNRYRLSNWGEVQAVAESENRHHYHRSAAEDWSPVLAKFGYGQHTVLRTGQIIDISSNHGMTPAIGEVERRIVSYLGLFSNRSYGVYRSNSVIRPMPTGLLMQSRGNSGIFHPSIQGGGGLDATKESYHAKFTRDSSSCLVVWPEQAIDCKKLRDRQDHRDRCHCQSHCCKAVLASSSP